MLLKDAVAPSKTDVRALGLDLELTKWQNLTQSLPLAVCVCDSQWRIVQANPEAQRLFGVGDEGCLKGVFVWHFLPESDRHLAQTQLELQAKVEQTEGSENWSFRVEPSLSGPFAIAGSRLLESDSVERVWQISIRVFSAHDKAETPITSATPQTESGLFEVVNAEPNLAFTWQIADGCINYWGITAQRLYGYTAEEAHGRDVAELLRTKLPGGIKPEAALKAEGEWSGEISRFTRAGDELILEARMKVTANSAVVLESNLDITPRRRAEQAFNFHFQLTQSITEQAVDPIFVIGGKGEVIFANPEAQRVFGWTREELLGRSLHDTLHHEHADGSAFPSEHCPLFHAQLNGTVIRALELVFFHRDGQPIYVSCSNSPLFFDNQEIGAVLIIRDISRQKVMERALTQSEERLRVAVAAAQMGTWDLNLVSGEASVDENCRRALNLDASGHNFVTSWLRAVHPEDRMLAKRQIETALNPTGDGQFQLECRTLAKAGGRGKGGVRSVQAQGQAFFDGVEETRRAVRLIGTIQDVTDRKRDEDALKRANDDLQQFAYAAAHDLQEPLRNVVNLLGLYKRNFGAQIPGGHSELIDASMEDARRMHQMVRDLLSFTNIHQGLENAAKIADANESLIDVKRNLATIIVESGATIHSNGLPKVNMRPTHLLQLLQNVVSNSLKYRRPEVPLQIRVGARRRGSEWLFSVSDNGIGFDPVYAQRIFGVFKRLHGRSEYPGSGIGLAICARIVHTYSGRIWAEGTLGQGATFFFTLPAAETSL